MTKHLETLTNRIRDQLVHMALFAVMFASLGYFIPRIYFQYFDHTEYYKVVSPIAIHGGPFKQCATIPITIHRVALVDLYGKSVINLFLIKESGKEKLHEGSREMVITKGEADVTTYWQLPCDIPNGTYYYDGVVNYSINGVFRQTFFSTETFVVKK